MKIVKKTAAMVLAGALLLCLLAACGGNSEDNAAVGTYQGLYTKFVGDSDDDRVTDEEFSLELKSNGKGVHHRDGMDFDITWKLDGESFSMSETFIGDPIEYTGTLKDGRLDLFNGDPEDIWTCEYVYDRQG